MKSTLLVFVSMLLFLLPVTGQVHKKYKIRDSKYVDSLDFRFTSPVGKCMVAPVRNPGLVSLHGDYEKQRFDPRLREVNRSHTKYVNFVLGDKTQEYSREDGKIQFSLMDFGESDEGITNNWKIYLSGRKPIDMDLNYGLGSAHINLSGLPVHRMHVTSGNANVNIDYQIGRENAIIMDTLRIKTEMGNIRLNNIHLANARNIRADIGFGEARMNFDQSSQVKTTIKANVGAGKLVVDLPSDDTPVLIRINETMLSSYNIPEGYSKKGKNVFINQHYFVNAPHALVFNIDVSMGKVIFQ